MNNRRSQSYDRTGPALRSEGFVFFKGDVLNTEWVDKLAKEFAATLSSNKMTINQLRAFYHEFLRIKELTERDDKTWIVSLKLLKAKASYRASSSSTKIPQKFVDFITELVNGIGSDSKKLSDACLVIEALVAYFEKPRQN